ncbi:MAG: class I SAM-dependent methyltransferase [Armatimonadetes bacterium]|nr:class I SAM-dependent methyltransferase [Armatimonadota bacterium]
MFLAPAWDVFTGAAWDAALNSVDGFSLGWHPWWWRLRAAAARQYLFDPPARVVLREAPALGYPDGQCTYGETPAVSLISMLRRLNVGSDDVLFDLGCGRGLSLMAACLALKIRGVGIDAVPTLVSRGRRIARDVGVDVTFVEGDFLDQDLSAGTIFYAASTAFNSDVMRRLTEKLDRPGLRVITLDGPLGAPFRVLESLRYPMFWGWSTCWLQSRD